MTKPSDPDAAVSRRTTAHMLVAAALLTAWLVGCGPAAPPSARLRTEVAWAGRGQWLKVDTHIHSRFSDGGHDLSEIAQQAVEFGCDAIALTDHADRDLEAATLKYGEAIEVARRTHPGLVVIAGLEWNVPPWGGDEHATVLVPPGADEFLTLAGFKGNFDDLGGPHRAELAAEALAWLAETAEADRPPPVVIYNHPSRKGSSPRQLVERFEQWRRRSDLVIGFEGAPGHQQAAGGALPGAYRAALPTVDRWDPAVAEVGGTWDRLLAAGYDVWAARADSDFHGPPNDYWPGEFSETWLYAPDRSADGVLRAYRAGTFFAAHGHIVREVQLRVDAAGLPRPAISGETVEAPVGSAVAVALDFTVPPTDWEGRPNRIDEVELIAVTSAGSRVVAQGPPAASGPALWHALTVPDDGVVLRACGRRVVPDGPDLLFYTNPIRIVPTSDVPLFGWLRPSPEFFRKILGGGIVLLLVLSLAIVAVRRIRQTRRLSRIGHGAAAVSAWGTRIQTAETVSVPRRIHFLAAAAAGALVMVYGSLVPFHLRPLPFGEAWAGFAGLPWTEFRPASRSDWGANFLLTVPVAACWLAAATFGAAGWLRRALGAGFVLVGMVALSLATEFAQTWFVPRVPSAADVHAQSAGAVCGLCLWLAFGPALADWSRRSAAGRPHGAKLVWVLNVYLAGLMIYSVLPFDLVTSPAELYHKFRDGRIVLAPRLPGGLSAAGIWDALVGALLFVPVGIWAVLVTEGRSRQTAPWRALALGGAFALAVEAAQVFVISRFAETGDVLLAWLGVAAGVWAGRWWDRRPLTSTGPDADAGWRITFAWVAGSCTYAAILLVHLWWPLDFRDDPAAVRAAWRDLLASPMASLYWSSEYTAGTQILRKIALFVPLGAGLWHAVRRHPLPRAVRRFLLLALFGALALFACGIEAVQVFLPARTPDLSDAGLYLAGSTLGVWLAGHFSKPEGQTPAPARESRRRQGTDSPRKPELN